MAGAKPGVHALQLVPLQVHHNLRKGTKFIRYDEDIINSQPALGTLKVDDDGFYVIWIPGGSAEIDILEISTIKDTRVGRYAKQPKEAKLREQLAFAKGKELSLLTIVYGQDMVNVQYWCFSAINEDEAKLWAHELFAMSKNVLGLNGSRNSFLLKAYTKLKLSANLDGRIPLKCFQKMFSDKKKVDNALEHFFVGGINKADGVRLEDFTWEAFNRFLDSLCPRPELQSIFDECGAKRKPFITLDQFMDFINTKQRDSRLNEVLYPPLKRDEVRSIMEQYEKPSQLERDQITLQGFSRYLGGCENGIVHPEKLDIADEMNCPLPHYFINSSHNTYLTLGQLTGLSSVEMYRQVLLTGCRCIELDCWKGRITDEEPYITHGFTMCTEIPFKDVIEAIAETAFKASPYPVILSFENHVDSPKQQAKMAEYCKKIFGEALLIDPLDKYPLVPGQPLPSPQDLIGKILIKNKKKDDSKRKDTIRRKESEEQPPATLDQEGTPSSGGEEKAKKQTYDSASTDEEGTLSSGGEEELAEKQPYGRATSEHGGEGESDEEEGEKILVKKETPIQTPDTVKDTASSETYATEEMSSLVNYIQPVKFKSFVDSAEKNRYFEMSSFVETKALEHLKASPSDFVEYNKKQISRIYPKGTRVDSSNYMPQIFWNAGCQMVALNFQTPDLPMQLNMGVFEYNGHCGYLLKPEFMRRADKLFDPFTENIVDGIVANTLKIKIISGQFLSERKVGVYVEVDIFGLPADTKRKFRTKPSNGNSLDPVWDEEVFTFYKLILPTLACMRITAYEDGGKFIGHRILPVSAIRPGYHYINLRNEINQSLLLPSLLVYTDVRDYVPNEHIEYAEALTNPIKHINMLTKRETQLACFMDDIDRKQLSGHDQKEMEVVSTESQASAQMSPAQMSPGLSEDSAESPKNPLSTKEDLVNTVLADIFYRPMSLEELMESKGYTKLIKKQKKEIDELRKKIQKKIQSERQKKRTVIDKSLKRKKSNSQDGSQVQEQHEEELLMLQQELSKRLEDMQWQHLREIEEKLKRLAADDRNSHMKKIKDVCDKERKEIQKMLERKRLNSLGDAKSKPGHIVEQNEINRKHIAESVEILRRLEKTQGLRYEKFEVKYKEVLQKVDAHIFKLRSQLGQGSKEECPQKPDDICQLRRLDLQSPVSLYESSFSSMPNDSTPTPSICSTSYSQSSQGTLKNSLDDRMMDFSTFFPSISGLSDAENSFN